MSQLVAAAQPQFILLNNDETLAAKQYQYDRPSPDYRSPWWPTSAGFVGSQGADMGLLAAEWYEDPEITRGVSARLGLVGVTRDQYGTPLPACTVRAFRTSDGALINETISDGNGAFMGNVYDATPHFIVFYKAGTPDVFGTTVNTLIGS